MNTLAKERLICRALCCTEPVYLEARCKLHYLRQCEREEYAAREAELEAGRAARIAAPPLKPRPRCTIRDCTRPQAALGLCQQHRSRQRRGVEVTKPIRPWGREASA